MSCGVMVFPGQENFVNILDLNLNFNWSQMESSGYFKYSDNGHSSSESDKEVDLLAQEILQT